MSCFSQIHRTSTDCICYMRWVLVHSPVEILFKSRSCSEGTYASQLCTSTSRWQACKCHILKGNVSLNLVSLALVIRASLCQLAKGYAQQKPESPESLTNVLSAATQISVRDHTVYIPIELIEPSTTHYTEAIMTNTCERGGGGALPR